MCIRSHHRSTRIPSSAKLPWPQLLTLINSLRPSDAYVSVNKPSLVQIMACRLVDAKPLSWPMPWYCLLEPWEQTSVKSKFYIIIREKHLKMCSGKWRSFCFVLNVLTFTRAWISYYTYYKMCYGINYSSPNFNGAAFEVCKWVCYFIHILLGIWIRPYLSMLRLNVNRISKSGPWYSSEDRLQEDFLPIWTAF